MVGRTSQKPKSKKLIGKIMCKRNFVLFCFCFFKKETLHGREGYLSGENTQ